MQPIALAVSYFCMLDWVLWADSEALLFFNHFHAVWLDSPVMLLTSEWVWLPFYAFLLWRVYKTFSLQGFGKCVVAIVMVIVLADQTTSRFMKPTFQRLRPSHEASLAPRLHLVADSMGNVYRGGKFGFASSHAANSFGLAMFFFLCFRKRWRGVGYLFVWAGIVSYTRIYLGVHYPLDILVGAWVGMCWAWVCFRLFCLTSKEALPAQP